MRNLLGLGLAVISLLSLNGCGSSSGANVITVTVSSTSNTLILGQSATLTATVSGATDVNVNWTPQFVSGKPPCQYTFTQTNGKTSALTNCPTDGSFGTLTNLQATGTATYTAPNTLPSTTSFPGLVIIVTAQSVQNTGKTGAANLTLISGISVVLTPQTASVPTQEQQQFSVLLTNDIGNKGVTWSITQNVPFTNSSGAAVNYPQLPTCSPTCGTITVPDPSNTSVALYTAPASIPTAITPAQTNNSNCPQNVTVVAASNSDNTELTLGTITIVTGGPITFNGISPSIAPQGATIWDLYLNAPNISSTATISLTGLLPKNSASGQIKILFPLPVSTTTTTTTTTCTNTTNPTSTGALLRLNESDLQSSGPVTVTIADPAQKCNGLAAGAPCSATGTGTFTIMPVRATSTASVPDDIVQGKQSQEIPVTIDGGYFGPGGVLAVPKFDGIGLLKNATTSTSRKLNTQLPSNSINSSSPGLYTLSVSTNALPAPFTNNPSITNMALFPDYSVTPPAVVSTIAPGYLGIPVGTNPTSANPSAMDIDPDLGVVVVAEVGAPAKSGPPPVPAVPSAIQFFAIGNKTLTPIDTTGTPCAVACPVTSQTYANVSINTPTGISVNRVLHTVAIVNYGNQSVTVLPIPVPGSGKQSSTAPFTLDISGALQGSISPAPIPYSIGVDPDSNLAIVAYSSSSTAISSAANVGFIVNLNPNTVANPWGCTLDHAINPASTKVGQCLTAQVTLNNGTYPQVAVAPHGHLALVTPGGSGVVRGVDVTQPSTANVILSSTLAAGLVTVTIDTTKCPSPLSDPVSGQPSPCPFSMIPGNSGSVLITGVKPGNSANSALFNGVFPVNVLSSNSFAYAVTNLTATDTGAQNCSGTSPSRTCATVFYGNPNQTYGISSTTQGIAINPVTHTAAIADANSTAGTQIWLLNSLDQSVTSFGFSADCTAFVPSCPVTPEFLATTDVAWQPYTNAVVSYNPNINQVSISDPVSGQRYAFACNTNSSFTPPPTPACVTNPTTPVLQQTFRQQIVLNGTGAASVSVQNGTTNTLNLFGGLAVDPGSNQAFVLKSGSGTIDVIDLGGPLTVTPIKPIHVSEVIVPSPTPGPGVIGGIPNALVPQATLTCTTPVPPATSCDLPGVQVFGDGFDSTTQVLLDGTSIPASNVTPLSSRQLSVTIPGALLGFPHHYALQAVTSGGQVGSVQSNAVDFIVVQAVDMSKVCATTSGQGTLPTSVAIADQIANGPFSPIALVSVTGCNSVVAIDINPTITITTNNMTTTQPNPHFGQKFGSPVQVGTSPEGIAISQPLGLAVVANNGSGTASVLDLTPLPMNSPVAKVPDVATGTNPTGVAIDDAIGVAIVTNTGSNTVSSLNLATLFASGSTAAATSLTPVSIGGIQQPLAVAIDPNRGTNNQGLAVVTSVELNNGAASTGGLQGVEIGFVTPILSTSFNSGIVSATPTGIVFDPTVTTTTTNSGVFYANSSGTNTITQFNPDSGGGASVNVGINPTSLAINPLTGAILTVNSASNTISIIDTLSNPFATRQTLGFPGSGTFGVAIDQFTNLAVIVDRANQRVFLFPMPN